MEQVPNSKKLIESKMATLIEQMQALPKNPRGFPKDKKKHASLQKQLDTLSGQLKKLQYVKPTGTKTCADLHKKDKKVKQEKKVEKQEKKVEKKEVKTKTRADLHKKPKKVKQEKKVVKKDTSKVVSTKGQKPLIRTKVEKKDDKKKVVKKDEPDVSAMTLGTPRKGIKRESSGLEKEMSAISASQDPKLRRQDAKSKTLAPSMIQDKREAANRAADLKASAELEADAKPQTDKSKSEPSKQANEAARAKREEAKGRGRSWKEGLDPITAKMEELFGTKRTAKEIKDDMKVTETLEKELGFTGGQKRGGRITRKKYAMNRGGKVASIRKPTRA